MVNEERRTMLCNIHSLIWFLLVYYRTHGEYDLIMSNKYQLHDSGIADEGLSDETGSIGEDFNNQSSKN